MKKEFTTDELLMIRGVVKSYLKEREGLDKYEGHKAMKKDLEAILEKINAEITEENK